MHLSYFLFCPFAYRRVIFFLQNNSTFLRIDTISATRSYDFFFESCVTDIADYAAGMPEQIRSLPGETERRKEEKRLRTFTHPPCIYSASRNENYEFSKSEN